MPLPAMRLPRPESVLKTDRLNRAHRRQSRQNHPSLKKATSWSHHTVTCGRFERQEQPKGVINMDPWTLIIIIIVILIVLS